MKRIISMAIGVLLLLGTAAFGQSLGEVARSARKGKTHQSAANHQYDDDNLPKNDHLSVVGPAPAANANGTNPTGEVSPQGQAAAQATATADKKAPAEERQRTAEEWNHRGLWHKALDGLAYLASSQLWWSAAWGCRFKTRRLTGR